MIYMLITGFVLILVGLSGYIIIKEDNIDESDQSNFSWASYCLL